MNNENYEEEEDNVNEQEDDDRLSYTLITLGLENLIHIFEENNISFIDLLLLSKEDLIELQLEMFQRNRIFHFSKLFSKYAKNYSISEISDFFGFNKQFIFNSAIYDRVIGTNNEEEEEYQNTGTFINNNNNFSNNDIYNQENMFNSQRQIHNLNNSDFDKEDIPEKLNIKKKEFQPKKYFNINNNNSKNNNKNVEEINKKKINNNKKVKGEIKEIQKKNEKKNTLNQKKRNNIKNNNYSNDNLSYTYDSINNSHNSNVKISKSNKAFQKYLEIQQESDSILEKLNKQKEDSEIIKHKYKNLLNKSKIVGPSKISKMIKELKNSMNDEMNDYEEEETKNNLNNENNNNNDNIDINEEYEKLINRIEEIETIKMNNNSLEHLNQIKNFINEKGIYITFDDIDKINLELDKLMKIISKKENLKKELENCNNKILESKKKLSDLDENGEFNKDFNVNEVEELDEEYDLDSKNNSNNKKRKK